MRISTAGVVGTSGFGACRPGFLCRALPVIVAILSAAAWRSSIVSADDLSDRAAPIANETVAASDAAFDPSDPELSADELTAIDDEETAAAFAAAPSSAAAPDTKTAAAPITVSSATAAAVPVADDDELWFVSSRSARCETDGTVRLHYWQLVDGRWISRTIADLQAADSSKRTCIHVHGNRVDFCKANAGGWTFYSTLTGGQTERPPMRFIIFTWPSDRIQGSGRKDVQAKAVRAECHAYYLAWFVRQLSPETPLSMVGYSFGTRVIGGGLHLLGGGTLRGRSVGPADERPGIRVVLLAAAMDNSHFLPGQAFQCGPRLIDQLLVTRNSADPAMKWYPLMYKLMLRRQRGQQALGYTGLAGMNCLPCLSGRVEYRDVTCAVGKNHDWSGCAYLMPSLAERMRRYIYQEPVATTSTAGPATPAAVPFSAAITASAPAVWAVMTTVR